MKFRLGGSWRVHDGHCAGGSRSLAAVFVLVLAAGLVALVPSPAQALGACSNYTYLRYPSGTQLHVPSIGKNTRKVNCILGRGNMGAGVKALQQALWACYGQNIAIDSDFGPATQNAVKNAQRYINSQWGSNLAVDGVYGPATREHFYFPDFTGGLKRGAEHCTHYWPDLG